MRLVIAGGSGYLGGLLIDYFAQNHEVVILTRNPKDINPKVKEVEWDGKNLDTWQNSLEGADVVINLSGKNINTRFTKENKAAILSSRINTTHALGKAILACKKPPKMWINASSIAIYPETWENAATEDFNEKGNDFLSEVSQKWEAAQDHYPTPETKNVKIRISLILGDDPGSALYTLKKLVKSFNGGKAGSGNQWISWMSEKDFVLAVDHIIQNELSGSFNFCSPYALPNKDFMKALRKRMGIPFGIPAPAFLVKIGAKFMDTAHELVLRSQHAYPENLLNSGFKFKHPKLEDVPLNNK